MLIALISRFNPFVRSLTSISSRRGGACGVPSLSCPCLCHGYIWSCPNVHFASFFAADAINCGYNERSKRWDPNLMEFTIRGESKGEWSYAASNKMYHALWRGTQRENVPSYPTLSIFISKNADFTECRGQCEQIIGLYKGRFWGEYFMIRLTRRPGNKMADCSGTPILPQKADKPSLRGNKMRQIVGLEWERNHANLKLWVLFN